MYETDARSIANPNHPVPEDVAQALAALNEQQLASLEREQQLEKLTRPTREERRALAELMGADGRKAGARAIGTAYADRINKAQVTSPIGLPTLGPIDIHPPAPALADPSFWWAETRWSVPSFYRATALADGLHFTGKFTYDDGDLFNFSFGATLLFGISTERLPYSPFGRWRSAPYVDLFGGLLGWTGPYDIFDGDSWCKVRLTRRQTVYQWGFGPTGPAQVVRGQAIESPFVINEENAHRAYRHGLGGYHRMPVVDFGGVFPGTVWSQLEVRFDVGLEGNSFLWLDPEVLLRAPQWPVVAI